MIEAIREMLSNPAMKHAAIVHWPIVLSALSILAALVSAVFIGKNCWLRSLTVVFLALFAMTAFLAINAGESAEGNLGEVPTAVHDVVHEHEEAAEILGIAGVVATVIAALVFVPKQPVRIGAAWMTVIATLIIGWRITMTAHLGGEAVYEYGAGVPNVSYGSSIGTVDDDDDSMTREGNGGVEPVSDDPKIAFFQTQVKPILNENCFGCHGSQSRNPFKLVSFDSMQTTGERGPAVVPGDPDASLLIEAVERTGDLQMPKKGDKLSDEEIAILRAWVADGAVWE